MNVAPFRCKHSEKKDTNSSLSYSQNGIEGIRSNAFGRSHSEREELLFGSPFAFGLNRFCWSSAASTIEVPPALWKCRKTMVRIRGPRKSRDEVVSQCSMGNNDENIIIRRRRGTIRIARIRSVSVCTMSETAADDVLSLRYAHFLSEHDMPCSI